MPRHPRMPNPLLLHSGGDLRLLPDDIREALGPREPLSLDEDAILEAIARLDPDGVNGALLRAVARECGWTVGGRVVDRVRRLTERGLVSRTSSHKALRLTDAGWHATGRLTPTECVWRDGYHCGRAALVAELSISVTLSDHTTAGSVMAEHMDDRLAIPA